MTHSHSLYIWKPPYSATAKGEWIEPAQVYTQEYAHYIAKLIHQDSRSVIKVVRYGLALACFPDEKTVQLVEKQIARQQQEQRNESN